MAYSPHATRAKNVPIVIQSGVHKTEITADQTQPLPAGETFRSIGTAELSAEGETTITLSNVGTVGFVILDAIQLVPDK